MVPSLSLLYLPNTFFIIMTIFTRTAQCFTGWSVKHLPSMEEPSASAHTLLWTCLCLVHTESQGRFFDAFCGTCILRFPAKVKRWSKTYFCSFHPLEDFPWDISSTVTEMCMYQRKMRCCLLHVSWMCDSRYTPVLVPDVVFSVFWSHPEGRSEINIAITLRLVTELGDIMQSYLQILLLTLCFISFFLLFVCLSLSLSPVAALLLHGCPDCGVCCGCWLLLWDTTWRQVAVLFPFPQVPKSSPA